MPKRHIPDYIVIKERVEIRNTLFGIAALAGLFAFGFFQNANAQGFLISAGITAVCVFIAAKIKTRKHYDGSVDRYR
jgi:hypothetical protein